MYGTVWVLGAGFSKPLGGPLLPDLFSSGSLERLVAAYGGAAKYEHLFDGQSSEVRRIYEDYGRSGEPRKRHWEDAEQFLESLDAAAFHDIGSPSANLVRALSSKSLGWLACAARRLVAAECCAFLKRADPETEKWAPFKRWLNGLGQNDSIITFNYDTVVETLARATKFDRLKTVLPGHRIADAANVNLLKLHGSVNWQFDGLRFRVHEDDEFALSCDAEQMVIASPGPTKLATAERLGELWRTAERILKNASAVVFIGYRFPPSDASSRRRLFTALAQNEQPYLALHTVLGPDTSDPATMRMRSLLLHAVRQAGRVEAVVREGTDYQRSPPRHYTLDVHPLWGEDFMDVFVGGHVTQAYRFPRA